MSQKLSQWYLVISTLARDHRAKNLKGQFDEKVGGRNGKMAVATIR